MKTISLALGCLLLTSQSFADMCSKENEVWNGSKCITVGISTMATAVLATKSVPAFKANLAIYRELHSGGQNASATSLYTSGTNSNLMDITDSLKPGDKVIIIVDSTKRYSASVRKQASKSNSYPSPDSAG